jgi:pyruvate/2-oxoglutarate dehydrogenase complex dihydrolipoamide dehydrogenase (E3) component
MRHDVIVIGSGQAGTPLAARLAEAHKSVLLVERKELGGTCVNTGCTPTKTMIASARAAHVARRAGRLAVRVGEVGVDLRGVVDRKDALVRQWREAVAGRLKRAGHRLRLLRGKARFVADREIEVAGERHSAETVILDVGAHAVVPPIPGLSSVPWFDNESLLDLRDLPRHLIVLGGGYVGCEFAQMFRRFGSEVTILDHSERLLSLEEPEASEAIEEVFRDEGIRLVLGAEARGVSPDADGLMVELDGETVGGSHFLLAVGRAPNTQDLGCEAAGIQLDGRGFIPVDDNYETSAKGVYAVGDVTGGPQFTHASWDDHRILFDVLAGRPGRRRSDRLIPVTVFTDPQLARVGLTEQQARRQGVTFELAAMPFSGIARAVETDEKAGTLKVLLDPETEYILGASIVGADAGELIHIFAVIMVARATGRTLVDAEYVHPTFGEGVQSVMMRFKRYALS